MQLIIQAITYIPVALFNGILKVLEAFVWEDMPNYYVSFAGLAQLHRHRTLNYRISEDVSLDATNKFFIPTAPFL